MRRSSHPKAGHDVLSMGHDRILAGHDSPTTGHGSLLVGRESPKGAARSENGDRAIDFAGAREENATDEIGDGGSRLAEAGDPYFEQGIDKWMSKISQRTPCISLATGANEFPKRIPSSPNGDCPVEGLGKGNKTSCPVKTLVKKQNVSSSSFSVFAIRARRVLSSRTASARRIYRMGGSRSLYRACTALERAHERD